MSYKDDLFKYMIYIVGLEERYGVKITDEDKEIMDKSLEKVYGANTLDTDTGIKAVENEIRDFLLMNVDSLKDRLESEV